MKNIFFLALDLRAMSRPGFENNSTSIIFFQIVLLPIKMYDLVVRRFGATSSLWYLTHALYISCILYFIFLSLKFSNPPGKDSEGGPS